MKWWQAVVVSMLVGWLWVVLFVPPITLNP